MLDWDLWAQPYNILNEDLHVEPQAYTSEDDDFHVWPPMYTFVGEEYNLQDDNPDFDISTELLRMTSKGLFVVENAISQAECLWKQLAYISYTFQKFINMPDSYDLELDAARALCQIDELLRQQTMQESSPLPPTAVAKLYILQRVAQDVAVLANSRFIDPQILQRQGIPPELLLHLEASFGTTVLNNDALWSRIGNSKYHIFTRGVRFGERKHRRGRGGRRPVEAATVKDLGEPLRIRTIDTTSSGIRYTSQTGAQASTQIWHAGFGERKHRRGRGGRRPVEAATVKDLGEPLRIRTIDTTSSGIRYTSQTGAQASTQIWHAAANFPVASLSSASYSMPWYDLCSSPDLGEPLHIYIEDSSPHDMNMKIEFVLKKHGICYNKELIDDIVTTMR